MKISEKQLASVIRLSGQERYEIFVKTVADTEEVWGLYNAGWALAGSNEKETVLPVWPAEEYARICAQDLWSDYEPKAFSLDLFLKDVLPRLEKDGVLVGVFYIPGGKGTTPSAEQLRQDISEEMARF